jgi:hypothetical protein
MRLTTALVIVLASVCPLDAKPRADGPAAPSDVRAMQIPTGARFTIFCDALGGLDHVERSIRLRDQLIAGSGLKDWYVIHQDDDQRSLLFHGFYRAFDLTETDKSLLEDARRAQADRQRIDQLTNAQGERLFARNLFQPLDSPDPDAPPEWSLSNAVGYWSVQIAAYTGGPERKTLAVESVRAAREAGVEAYYFHGPAVSSVCVGVWPRESVQTSQEPNETIVQRGDEMVVVTNSPSAPINVPTGRAQVHRPDARVVDPTLRAVIDQYPQHATNGFADSRTFVDSRTGQRVLRPQPPLLVRIPRPQLGGRAAVPALDADPPADAPASTGGLRDRLRTLGDE